MKEVRILGQVITQMYGTLSAGMILRTDDAFAAHLVTDCSAAEYVKPTPKAAAAPESAAPANGAKPSTRKKSGVPASTLTGSEGLGTVIVPELVPLHIDLESAAVPQEQISADVCTPAEIAPAVFSVDTHKEK